MEHYTNINAMVQAADLTLPPPEKEPDRQYYFIKKLQQHIAQKEQEKGRKLTCNIKTFGCQMNARDSEKILGILQTIGYEETDSEQLPYQRHGHHLQLFGCPRFLADVQPSV